MMKQMTLRELLNEVQSRPPKKLPPSLNSEIHAKCKSPDCLDDILASLFFQNVAWRFFHADITNTHLELILQLVTYEYETYSRKTCLEMMEKTPKKIAELILRVLQSTLAYRKKDMRLQACIFLFLRVLFMVSPNAIVSHRLFKKWSELIFASYAQALKASSSNSMESKTLLHCFLSLCISCIMLPLTGCSQIIENMWIPFQFMSENLDFLSQRLAGILWLLLKGGNPVKSFTSFQIMIETLGLEGKLPLAEYAVLAFDVSAEKLMEELLQLSESELVSLAEWVGYVKLDHTKEILTLIITHSVLNSGLSYARLYDYTTFTENDVFDLFDVAYEIPFCPHPFIPLSTPLSQPLTEQITAYNAFEYLQKANNRALNVMDRLTITDPSSDHGIKGSSKYFASIKSVNIAGSKAHLEFKNSKLYSAINPGDFLLLMELGKPNRYGGVTRMVKYGIYTCRITKVHSISDQLAVEWNTFLGFEKRFNAVILLPFPHKFTLNGCEEMISTQSLADLWNNGPEKTPLSLTIDCINKDTFESMGAEILTKKRKLDANNMTEVADIHVKYNGVNVNITLSGKHPTLLCEDMSRALMLMLLQKTSTVQPGGTSNNATLINAFLRNFSANWPDQSCLIVFPTEAAVDLFPVDNELSSFCTKRGSNHVETFRKINDILEKFRKVSEISNYLRLDEYDFTSSIQNALMLYHSHIEPQWSTFLKGLSKEHFGNYPFASFETKTFEKVKENIAGIVDHFCGIRVAFSSLGESLPLDKFDLLHLRKHDYHEISAFFENRCKYLMASEENLPSMERSFDTVIIHRETSIPLIKSGCKKIIMFGDPRANWTTRQLVKSVQTRPEIAQLTGHKGTELEPLFNPGFRFCIQHVRVPYTKQHVNVEEAKYCVYLYQYMRLLGYKWETVLIGVKSERMHFLLEEILQEQKISANDPPSDDPSTFSYGFPIIQNVGMLYAADFLIVSCTGSPSLREYQLMAENSRRGLYLVGPELDFGYTLESGNLETVTDESFRSLTRTSPTFKLYSDAFAFYEHIKQMSKETFGIE